jgi:hypothetical protein
MATRVRIGAAALLVALLATSVAHGSAAKRADRIAAALAERGFDQPSVRCKGRHSKGCRFSALRWKANGSVERCRARVRVRRGSVRISRRRCAPEHSNLPWPDLGFNGAVSDHDVALSRRAGATTSRIVVNWGAVEAIRGNYDFSQVAPDYERLVKAGVPPVVSVMGSPAWAWPAGLGECGLDLGCAFAPARQFDADWQRLVIALIQRFPAMRGLEVWNEPNWNLFWPTGADPGRYAELVSLADAAAGRTAANPPIVFAGLYPGGGRLGWVEPEEFLSRAYAHGVRYDVLGVHSYPSRIGGGGFLADFREQVEGLWKVAAEFGDEPRTWLTEVGVSTRGVSIVAASEQEQATALTQIYDWSRRTRRIGLVIVHKLRDSVDIDGSAWGFGLGLRRADGTPKPAYCALAALRSLPCS